MGGGHAQFTEASGSRVPHPRFADLPSKARCATRSQTGLPTTCSEWPRGTLTTRRDLAGAGASRPRAAPGHSRRPRGLREARLRGPGKRDCPLRYRSSSARRVAGEDALFTGRRQQTFAEVFVYLHLIHEIIPWMVIPGAVTLCSSLTQKPQYKPLLICLDDDGFRLPGLKVAFNPVTPKMSGSRTSVCIAVTRWRR